MAEQFEITAPDGAVLRGYRWRPDGAVRGVVQIAHGMAEHAARYEEFARALNAAGFAVYANDHRGHGRTADGATLGFFAPAGGWRLVTDDLRLVTRHAVQEEGDMPVVLFGHSMGSLLARTYAGLYGRELAGLVLSGTPADVGALGRVGQMVARLEGRLRGATHPSKLLDSMSFGTYNKAFSPARTSFDWLSRDEDAVDAYVADPKCGFVCTDSFYGDLLSGLALVNEPSFAAGTPSSLPTLVISGDADPAGKNGEGVTPVAELLREVGVRDVTLTLYPGARHEILNETNRDEVTRDVLTWLEAHVPSSAGA